MDHVTNEEKLKSADQKELHVVYHKLKYFGHVSRYTPVRHSAWIDAGQQKPRTPVKTTVVGDLTEWTEITHAARTEDHTAYGKFIHGVVHSGGERVFAARGKRLCRRPPGAVLGFYDGGGGGGALGAIPPFPPHRGPGGAPAETKFSAFLPSKYTI